MHIMYIQSADDETVVVVVAAAAVVLLVCFLSKRTERWNVARTTNIRAFTEKAAPYDTTHNRNVTRAQYARLHSRQAIAIEFAPQKFHFQNHSAVGM